MIVWSGDDRRTMPIDKVGESFTCREWQPLPVGGDGLSERDARRLLALAKRAGRRFAPPAEVLTRTDSGLRACQVVGILALPGGPVLEILPKIDHEDGAVRAALVRMLAVAWGLRVADGELAAMRTQRHDLLEVLIRLFTARLLTVVRRGLPRRYLEHQEDLNLLRGRLNVTRQVTRFVGRPDLFACRFDEWTEDTPLNRVLKAAVAKLADLTRSADTRRRLAELAARLEFAGDTADPLREPVRLDRTNAAFHDVYHLACRFLAREWQDTATGAMPGFALLFPMNELFEEFIGRSMARAVSAWRVRLQHQKHYAIDDDAGPLFALRPDIVVDTPDGAVVLDTKWKRLTFEDDKLGIASSDIYQMAVYGDAYRAQRVVLIYPWHEGVDQPPGIVRHWSIRGTGRRLDVATVDVGRPAQVVDTLRRIVWNLSAGAPPAGPPAPSDLRRRERGQPGPRTGALVTPDPLNDDSSTGGLSIPRARYPA